MIPRDWTLLAISFSPRGTLSPVQLQKSLFILGKHLAPNQLATERFYHFEPYDYGPFTPEIYSDAERLARDGFITILQDAPVRSYLATPQGKDEAARLAAGLDPIVREYATDVLKWVTSLSFNDLVRAVYEMEPGMKVNSVFRD